MLSNLPSIQRRFGFVSKQCKNSINLKFLLFQFLYLLYRDLKFFHVPEDLLVLDFGSSIHQDNNHKNEN